MINKYKAHPWHGISPGNKVPEIVTAFIEIVPSDTVKYEIDKESGFLKVDRPQKFSNIVPTLYGFIPQTYCGRKIAEFAAQKTSRDLLHGDGDPLDICVLSEKQITHGDIIMQVIPIGGFRLIDKGEADDKIIAVMLNDALYGAWETIQNCPEALIQRLKHYFLTYKNLPGATESSEITHIYDKSEAHEVIQRSLTDYQYEVLKK